MGVFSVLAFASLPFVYAQTPVISNAASVFFTGQYHPTSYYVNVTLSKEPTTSVSFNVGTGTSIKASTCQLTFNSTNWNIPQTVYLMPYSPNSNGAASSFTISVGSVTATIKSNNERQYSCYSYGDPHIGRIDSRLYHYQTPHPYWLVQTPRLSVQCQAKECFYQSGGACNRLCVVHYTDGDKKAAFAFFPQLVGSSITFKTSILKDEGILKNVRRETSTTANKMWLEFPDGSQLSTDGYLDVGSPVAYEFMNIYVTIPAIYQRLSGGFCGSTTSTFNNPETILPINGQNTTDGNLWQYAWTLNPEDTVYNLVYKALKAKDNLTSYELVDKDTMFSKQFKSDEMIKYLNDMKGDADVTMGTCTNGNRDGTFGLIDTPFPYGLNYSLPVFSGFYRLNFIINSTSFYPGTADSLSVALKKREDSEETAGVQTAEAAQDKIVIIEVSEAETTEKVISNQMDLTINRTSQLYLFTKQLLSSDLSPCVKLVESITVDNDADACYLDAKQIIKSQNVINSTAVFEMYISTIAKRCQVLSEQVLQLVSQDVQDAVILAISNNQTLTGLQGLTTEQSAALEAQSLLGSGYYTGTLQCMNGGTLDESGSSCICQNGFIGTNCSVEFSASYQVAYQTQTVSAQSSASTFSLAYFAAAAFFLVYV